jgi:hypothetical protein
VDGIMAKMKKWKMVDEFIFRFKMNFTSYPFKYKDGKFVKTTLKDIEKILAKTFKEYIDVALAMAKKQGRLDEFLFQVRGLDKYKENKR